MELLTIIMKLNGMVHPTGEHGTDQERLVNLKNLTDLFDSLLLVLVKASNSATRHEDSMKKIGQYAQNYLIGVHDLLTDYREGREGKADE